jgi:hypothetical protein
MANRFAPNSNRASAKLRCAIYTRKSSEEGLEQDFNSLHAQREACEAFIASQKREGWTPTGAAFLGACGVFGEEVRRNIKTPPAIAKH